jgi:Raf kinase inhibitor-like YbhB/YbcL family protein
VTREHQMSFWAVLGLVGLAVGCSLGGEGPDDVPGSAGSSVGGNFATGGMLDSGGTPGAGTGGSTFLLTSPAFENVGGCSVESPGPCATFPDENVSYLDNANISPELEWTGVPFGTQSFALVLFDVTYGQAHWVLWNIPADAVMLAADVAQDTKMLAKPPGSEQANANFATTSDDGYFGPHIPCNVFEFELYALSLPTFSPENPDSAVLVHIELQELGAPVLGIAKLTGRSANYGMTCD